MNTLNNYNCVALSAFLCPFFIDLIAVLLACAVFRSSLCVLSAQCCVHCCRALRPPVLPAIRRRGDERWAERA